MIGFGCWTLFKKEVWRFLKVFVQTVLAPAVSTLLYLLVFGVVFEEAVVVYEGHSYSSFLIPGLVMMTLAQNAFANSSSSILQSKMNGNIVFMLLAPLSSLEVYIAFLGAAILRGLITGGSVLLIASLLVDVEIYSVGLILLFALLASGVLGALGIIAGIWSEKYDHLSAFQNFIILPLTFLSGVFFSIQGLSPFWQQVSAWNPVFYLIDGFRYGFLGVSDVPYLQSVWVALLFLVMLTGISVAILRSGYKLRG
ncbi:MAG: ABC transporter permease [Gammaproteobacteria bacterium]|jgi:ABC-2 type transport system permease protein|nr:ABC transporter permease [Gammaproteobacteria bacterium]MBT4607376.1 ABC transporter permease [Thiotrichales bacterium]MBT3472248.1 ABC transporter permease [Gammaproteobacteria bacterium]MBT3966945.1 ABC transporter permease [Gammaproteobacteria bacterium]MBT4079484.1 ABC transporter permease [Gammaproteobacteria bacterium]